MVPAMTGMGWPCGVEAPKLCRSTVGAAFVLSGPSLFTRKSKRDSGSGSSSRRGAVYGKDSKSRREWGGEWEGWGNGQKAAAFVQAAAPVGAAATAAELLKKRQVGLVKEIQRLGGGKKSGRKGKDPVVEALERAKQAGLPLNTIIYNAAIRQSGSWAASLALLQELKDHAELKPDIISFGSALVACSLAGRWEESEGLLTEMEKEHGLQPDVRCYTSLMAAYSTAGRYDAALGVLATMVEEKGLKPDIVAYNTAITASGQAGRPDRALQVVQEMEQRGLKLNVISYSALVTAYGNAGQHEKALQVVKEDMKSAGLRPDVITYGALLSACGKAGALTAARDVLAEMRERGPRPNAACHVALVSACVRAGQLDDAVTAWRGMAAEGGGLLPDLSACASLVSALGKAGRHADGLELLREALRLGLRPDMACFNNALFACGKAGDVDACLSVLRDMKAEGRVEPDAGSLSSLLMACGRAGSAQKALNVFRKMRSAGLTPRETAYNALLLALAEALEGGGEGRGKMRLVAGEVVKDMKRVGFKPSTAVSTAFEGAGMPLGQEEKGDEEEEEPSP